MHNCKLTRASFVELALDEIPSGRATQLLAELNDCRACREEYAALGSTLHVSSQALKSALPGDEFWPGYRTRLHAKLLASPAQQIEKVSAQPAALAFVPGFFGSKFWLALRTLATTSVRVPVPAALGLLLIFGAFFFVQRSRGAAKAAPSNPIALVRTDSVPAPVVEEKVITRVVYVEKKDRRSRNSAKRSDRFAIPGGTNNNVVQTGPGAATGNALSLSGFRPTEEVKLTIIKGSDKDQKR